MTMETLLSISPLDGRYHPKLSALRMITSEYGLIRYRTIVEVEWLICLIKNKVIKTNEEERTILALNNHLQNFTLEHAHRIKVIEQTTNHDVKAVEYGLREQFEPNTLLRPLLPYIHFACTSEDINNLAYGLMLRDARQEINQQITSIVDQLKLNATRYATLSMLSRTHGQPASPTTLGKEFANVLARIRRQHNQLNAIPILAKYNGAVGNYNAHTASDPQRNWPELSKHFIEHLGLSFNPYTTQIEPHDALADFLHTLSRINTILIDFCRDTWHYISLNYFTLKKIEGEVGSSTMPHKINPIDFENAEGNLGIANALAAHMASKLPISRLQRDLSDSTVLRNLGVVIGHSVLSYLSILKGLEKCRANPSVINADLNAHWEVIAEPIQTVLRAHGVVDAYEQLKQLTRGKGGSKEALHAFIKQLELPEAAQQTLLALTPASYTGHAATLAQEV